MEIVAEKNENKENNEKTWRRHEEHQYLDHIRHIMSSGKTRLDRTGVGIYLFHLFLRYILFYQLCNFLNQLKFFQRY